MYTPRTIFTVVDWERSQMACFECLEAEDLCICSIPPEHCGLSSPEHEQPYPPAHWHVASMAFDVR
jgi:hypothetical protein